MIPHDVGGNLVLNQKVLYNEKRACLAGSKMKFLQIIESQSDHVRKPLGKHASTS
jgi:hypothetical protein